LPKGGPLLTLGYFAALLFTPLYFTLMTIMGYCRIKVTWKGERIPVIRQRDEEPAQRRSP
ncbi:MAG: hypothetical protein LBS37_09035, partial [Treponema sp.]|nr:hypothetical protein [Treponema sp.]